MHAVRFHVMLGEERVLPLPENVQLAPGPAEVIVLQATETHQQPASPLNQSLPQRLLKKARELDLRGLPEDLAENHDHYIHGSPKVNDPS